MDRVELPSMTGWPQADLEKLFGLAQDILCISSSDGYFKRISSSVTAVLGWTTEEFLARPYLDFVHPDDLDSTISEVQRQVIAGQHVFYFENRYRHKDGSWRILAWKSTPQPGGLMFATARDVTLQKQIEGELVRRSLEVEAVNKDLEAFTYSASHDLRGPLRGISTLAHLLSEDYGRLLDDEGRRLLAMVKSEAIRMGRLIDDLLDFSRLGRKGVLFTSVDMKALAQDVYDHLEPEIRAKVGEFQLGELAPAYGDPAMLKQVFYNLISNAIKFSGTRDYPEIEVGSMVDLDRNRYFVKDNGVGFDPKYATKLFEVFERLHGQEEFEGTGVGLALVQRIVELHGGTIEAESEVNQGATFYFDLPRPA